MNNKDEEGTGPGNDRLDDRAKREVHARRGTSGRIIKDTHQGGKNKGNVKDSRKASRTQAATGRGRKNVPSGNRGGSNLRAGPGGRKGI